MTEHEAYYELSNFVEQEIADLFPDEFPLYPEDWPPGRARRCVGDHVPESMLMLLIRRYKELKDAS